MEREADRSNRMKCSLMVCAVQKTFEVDFEVLLGLSVKPIDRYESLNCMLAELS